MAQRRLKTTRNLFDKKPVSIIRFADQRLAELIGTAERKGLWLIRGEDKNGKTATALKLARDLSVSEPCAYISAEEGLDLSFQEACRRAGISFSDRILWEEYMSQDEIVNHFKKPSTPKILFLDNLTIYQDEIKSKDLKAFLDKIPKVLVVALCHEERGQPYPAVAKMANKLAKVIFRVRGLKAEVVSRYAAGGSLIINEEKAELYHGPIDEE